MSEEFKIDLNADAGESAEDLRNGCERALYRLVSSVNIACGGHAGTMETMAEAVDLAIESGVAIGAHPSYPDTASFGRKVIELPHDELVHSLLTQMRSLDQVCRARGAKITHVKPHGALYNRAALDIAAANAVLDAVEKFDASLLLVGLARSSFHDVCRTRGMSSAGEGFVDRRYEADGTLRSRLLDGAVFSDPNECARQALELASKKSVATLCIHGDHPNALGVASAVRASLELNGWLITSLR